MLLATRTNAAAPPSVQTAVPRSVTPAPVPVRGRTVTGWAVAATRIKVVPGGAGQRAPVAAPGGASSQPAPDPGASVKGAVPLLAVMVSTCSATVIVTAPPSRLTIVTPASVAVVPPKTSAPWTAGWGVRAGEVEPPKGDATPQVRSRRQGTQSRQNVSDHASEASTLVGLACAWKRCTVRASRRGTFPTGLNPVLRPVRQSQKTASGSCRRCADPFRSEADADERYGFTREVDRVHLPAGVHPGARLHAVRVP